MLGTVTAGAVIGRTREEVQDMPGVRRTASRLVNRARPRASARTARASSRQPAARRSASSTFAGTLRPSARRPRCIASRRLGARRSCADVSQSASRCRLVRPQARLPSSAGSAHPGQQRRHHPRQPAVQDDRRRLGPGHRRAPARRVPDDPAAQKHFVEQKYGKILNLSSVSALGNRGQANYPPPRWGSRGSPAPSASSWPVRDQRQRDRAGLHRHRDDRCHAPAQDEPEELRAAVDATPSAGSASPPTSPPQRVPVQRRGRRTSPDRRSTSTAGAACCDRPGRPHAATYDGPAAEFAANERDSLAGTQRADVCLSGSACPSAPGCSTPAAGRGRDTPSLRARGGPGGSGSTCRSPRRVSEEPLSGRGTGGACAAPPVARCHVSTACGARRRCCSIPRSEVPGVLPRVSPASTRPVRRAAPRRVRGLNGEGLGAAAVTLFGPNRVGSRHQSPRADARDALRCPAGTWSASRDLHASRRDGPNCLLARSAPEPGAQPPWLNVRSASFRGGTLRVNAEMFDVAALGLAQ